MGKPEIPSDRRLLQHLSDFQRREREGHLQLGSVSRIILPPFSISPLHVSKLASSTVSESWNDMGPYSRIDAQFNRAVEIVQNLPKTGPIQTGYEDKLNMYR